MRRRVVLGGLAAVLAVRAPGPAPVHGQESVWLPEAAEGGMAEQLAQRLAEIGVEKTGDAAPVVERARKEVRRQRLRVESWGRQGLLQRKPELARLEMPASGDETLDAMARYQMCNAILYMSHVDHARERDAGARLTAAKGLTGVTLAVVYLGRPLLGNESRMKDFLTGQAMEAVLERVQERPELREYAARQCRPLVSALLEH